MDYFDQIAEEWDDLRAEYFDETVRGAAIEQAELSPEMVVADVSTGSGFSPKAPDGLSEKCQLGDFLDICEDADCSAGVFLNKRSLMKYGAIRSSTQERKTGENFEAIVSA